MKTKNQVYHGVPISQLSRVHGIRRAAVYCYSTGACNPRTYEALGGMNEFIVGHKSSTGLLVSTMPCASLSERTYFELVSKHASTAGDAGDAGTDDPTSTSDEPKDSLSVSVAGGVFMCCQSIDEHVITFPEKRLSIPEEAVETTTTTRTTTSAMVMEGNNLFGLGIPWQLIGSQKHMHHSHWRDIVVPSVLLGQKSLGGDRPLLYNEERVSHMLRERLRALYEGLAEVAPKHTRGARCVSMGFLEYDTFELERYSNNGHLVTFGVKIDVGAGDG